jgi:hypothetical protein
MAKQMDAASLRFLRFGLLRFAHEDGEKARKLCG